MRYTPIIVLALLTGCAPAIVCESTYPETWTPSTWLESCAGNPLALDDYADYVITLEVGDEPGEVRHATTWAQGHNPFTTSTDGADFEFLAGDMPDSACGGFNGLHDQRFVNEMAQGSPGYSRTSDVDAGDASGCWWAQVVPLELYPGVQGYLDGYAGPMGFGWHRWQVLTVETM